MNTNNKVMYITPISVPDFAHTGYGRFGKTPTSFMEFCIARNFDFLKCWDDAESIEILVRLIKQREYEQHIMFDMFMEMFVYLAKNVKYGTPSDNELADYITCYEQSWWPPLIPNIWGFTFRNMVEFNIEGNVIYFEQNEPFQRCTMITRKLNKMAKMSYHKKELAKIMKRYIKVSSIDNTPSQ